jgi:hypothetical protein
MFAEAIPLYEQVSDWQGKADCIRGVGQVAALQSSYDEARAMFEEAIFLYERVSDRQSKALCIRCLGEIARRQSRNCGIGARLKDWATSLPHSLESKVRAGNLSLCCGWETVKV